MHKIGLLGGTFDPIHEGHLIIAEQALKQFKLDTVEFIPCFQPPTNKNPTANPVDRLAMVRLALENKPHFRLNDIEIQRQGISYSVDTLTALHQQQPQNTFYFIVGSDVFSQFHTWHEWQSVLMQTHLIVINRKANEIITPKPIADFLKKTHQTHKIHILIHKKIPISATQIRKEILSNKNNITGLSKQVEAYICEKKLYLAE